MAKDLWPQKTHLDLLMENSQINEPYQKTFQRNWLGDIPDPLECLCLAHRVEGLPVKTIREEQFQQRQNRFTGQVETWIPAEIKKVGGYYVGDKAGTWTKDYQ